MKCVITDNVKWPLNIVSATKNVCKANISKTYSITISHTKLIATTD